MIKIIHVADLHLSEGEKDYGLSVLAEIVSLASQNQASYLIFAGDTFDTFTDAENMRRPFRETIKKLPQGCRVFLLPGNHEEHEKGNKDFSALDFGQKAEWLLVKPFRLLAEDEVEFLYVPHQVDYEGYLKWEIPGKKARYRIAILHGVVTGLDIFTREEETGGTAIAQDFFQRFGVDYAALGHIHQRRNKIIGQTELNYPGSARVWRKGEFGEKGINLLSLKEELSVKFIPLASAGVYREYDVALGLDGTIPSLAEISAEWGKNDFVFLNLSGVVENENILHENLKELTINFGEKVRKIDWDMDKVETLPGISQNALVKTFLEVMERKKPSIENKNEAQLWHRARLLGLQEIKKILEARK